MSYVIDPDQEREVRRLVRDICACSYNLEPLPPPFQDLTGDAFQKVRLLAYALASTEEFSPDNARSDEPWSEYEERAYGVPDPATNKDKSNQQKDSDDE